MFQINTHIHLRTNKTSFKRVSGAFLADQYGILWCPNIATMSYDFSRSFTHLKPKYRYCNTPYMYFAGELAVYRYVPVKLLAMHSHCRYWRPSLSILGLAVLCFYSETGFWFSYCQISTDLDKILHTPIVIRNTLVGRLRLRSAGGRLRAKPKRLCFLL